MLCFRAVISYYLILFRPIAALQVAAIKNLFHFYSSPVALGQIYFVLVLISTNHNARYLYPEMDISPGLNNIQGKEVVPKYGFCPLFLTGSKQLIRGLGGFFVKKKTVRKNVGYQI